MAVSENTLDPHNAALQSELPNLYVNGFSLALSNADLNMVLMRNGLPQAVLNLSYTSAKSLADTLTEAVSRLEKATGKEMLTADAVERALSDWHAS